MNGFTSPALGSPERAARLACLGAIRQLRLSAAQGRPMSLANLLRLYRRRVANLAPPVSPEAGLEQIRRLYLQRQPF